MEFVLRSGDLNAVTFSDSSAYDPVRIHKRIQKKRPAEYRSEVTVAHQIEQEHFILSVQGRIDGVYESPSQIVIDEIKTTTENLATLTKQPNPVHWGQAKTYAYLYAMQHKCESIGVQLTYYHVETNKQEEIRHRYTIAELKTFVDSILTYYTEWIVRHVSWLLVRDAAINALQFPFAQYRAGQRTMVVHVYKAIQHKKTLFVQAATGIGKTVGALVPVIKHLPLKTITRFFFLTARTTGKVSAEHTLAILRKNQGLRLKSLTLTAKDKICFLPERICSPAECCYAKGHYDRINAALIDALSNESITADTVKLLAQKHQVCPFEFSLDMALWVDCIIGDYNYVFDPRVYLRRFFEEEGSECAFIVDEAHNLVDRAREMYSAELEKESVRAVRRLVRKTIPNVSKNLNRINTQLRSYYKMSEQHNAVLCTQQSPQELIALVQQAVFTIRRWLIKNESAPFRDALVDLYFKMNLFLMISQLYSIQYVTYYEKNDKNLVVRLYCLDPSVHIKNVLNRCIATVFLSATLTPMNYFKTMFGCTRSASSLTLPAPFPRENLAIIIAHTVSTLYQKRNETYPLVADYILSLLQARRGNYLIFFPSYKYLNLVHEAVCAVKPDLKSIVQTPQFSEKEREQFLRSFHENSDETLAGFAVMGGVFGEGVDLVGDTLIGVVVVGVGLPGISPQRDCIKDYFNTRGEKGFSYAYQYPGIIKVFQAAGRVIRSDTDRGVVVLIDQRFAEYRYRSLFPHDWQPSYVQSPRQLSETLERFWNETR